MGLIVLDCNHGTKVVELRTFHLNPRNNYDHVCAISTGKISSCDDLGERLHANGGGAPHAAVSEGTRRGCRLRNKDIEI